MWKNKFNVNTSDSDSKQPLPRVQALLWGWTKKGLISESFLEWLKIIVSKNGNKHVFGRNLKLKPYLSGVRPSNLKVTALAAISNILSANRWRVLQLWVSFLSVYKVVI